MNFFEFIFYNNEPKYMTEGITILIGYNVSVKHDHALQDYSQKYITYIVYVLKKLY